MYSTPTIVNNTALHIRVDLKSAHQEIIKILSLKKKKKLFNLQWQCISAEEYRNEEVNQIENQDEALLFFDLP